MIAPLCWAQEKPNVVIFLVDDMGYSDIGCYGGEIMTPNLDKLASTGVRFTQFYNTSRSCPARASLMTGLYQHQAGIGQMSEDPFKNPGQKSPNDWGVPGWQVSGTWVCMGKRNGLCKEVSNASTVFWQVLPVTYVRKVDVV